MRGRLRQVGGYIEGKRERGWGARSACHQTLQMPGAVIVALRDPMCFRCVLGSLRFSVRFLERAVKEVIER